MNCNQAQQLFNTYLDGELSGTLAAELGAHQLQCARCRRELALLEVTGHIVATDTDTPLLGLEFADRLVACEMRRDRPWYQHPRYLRFAGAGLAMAACLMLVFTFWTGSESSPAEPAKQTWVLGENHVASPDEMLANIDEILSRDPQREDLREIAEAIRQRGRTIVNETQDGAEQLENFGQSTIMEILDAVRLEQAEKRDSENHDADAEDL